MLSKKERIKENKNKIIALTLACTSIMSLPSCKSKKEETVDSSNYNIVYQDGDHEVLKVEQEFNMTLGKNGKYGLVAPEGYIIKDYDYDKNFLRNFNDFVYVNNTEIKTNNPNNLGVPTNEIKKQDDGIYKAGTHIIADINRSLNPFWGKNEKMDLVAPLGYTIMDYDYDKTKILEFETVTYVNSVDVKTDDINEFGVPLNKIDNKTKDYYDVGEHKIIEVKRNVDLLYGKEKMFSLSAPKGYRVIDYDYDYNNDKNNIFEFETITYENITPVTKKANDFGTPIDPTYEELLVSGENYLPGSHILVDIRRGASLLFGDNGTKVSSCPPGYVLLDYDYEKTSGVDFETFVYINKEEVILKDPNNFGVMLSKVKIKSK